MRSHTNAPAQREFRKRYKKPKNSKSAATARQP